MLHLRLADRPKFDLVAGSIDTALFVADPPRPRSAPSVDCVPVSVDVTNENPSPS